jgi:hypothetical protein
VTADGSGKRLQDTTLLRIAKDVGFNARIESLWHTFRRRSGELGFFERRKERKRLERIAAAVGAHAGPAAGDWAREADGCVCNLRVAKMGLVKELKNYLQAAADGRGPETWPHLFALRDRPCMVVPCDFAKPGTVQPAGGEEAFPFSSGVRLQAELGDVNARLRIDETFALKKMPDFLDATEKEISVYEARMGTQEGFWPRFTFVLLKKLADVGVEKRFPVLMA